MRKVCVCAGARGGAELMPDAHAIGKLLARTGVHVWYGGSNRGVMGALSAGVIEAGGRITGVLPATIAALNHFNPDVDMIITADMPTFVRRSSGTVTRSCACLADSVRSTSCLR